MKLTSHGLHYAKAKTQTTGSITLKGNHVKPR
jgi:hypothetical protein